MRISYTNTNLTKEIGLHGRYPVLRPKLNTLLTELKKRELILSE